mgnify:FL=1
MKRRAPISEAELRRAEKGPDPTLAEVARLIRDAIALLEDHMSRGDSTRASTAAAAPEGPRYRAR